MKICIDARCLSEGRRTGVEEYMEGLLKSLFEIDSKNEYILFLNSWKEPNNDFSWTKKYSNVRIKKLKIPNKVLNFSFWYFNWPKIDVICGGADIVFLPNIIFAGISSRAKLILTVHDLSYKRYPQYFSWKRRFWHIFVNAKKICQKAQKIIAISDSTRNDIIELYQIPERKIEKIYSAMGEKFRIIDRNDPKLVKTKEKYHLPYKFILFLGTIEPRKNVIGLIEAFEEFQEKAEVEKNNQLKKYSLVIAGSKGWLNEKIFFKIKNSKFSSKIKLINFVDEEDKEYIYNLASIFVFPSFFEGFGFPPLEAMKCGVPVIVSNNSSLPEVVGEGAVLVDPERTSDIAVAMKEILTDKKFTERLIKKGLIRANCFNWEKTARQTLAFFCKKNF